MSKEWNFVFCEGILGVNTNIRDFKWVYGSAAPEAAKEVFENCLVKMNVQVVPEKCLPQVTGCESHFQAYSWNDHSRSISCRRTLFRLIHLGYDIRIEGNNIFAVIGENYFKLLKSRIMNLHGMYYLLADLANVILLRNGYLTLYASAVFCEGEKRGVVNFAPPNTGKTYTVMNLCSKGGYRLVGEDVVITDGSKVFACPWTSSYRRSGAADSAGSLGRRKGTVNEKIGCCDLTDLTVLSRGKNEICEDKNEIFSRICMLNGYLFQYYSSPIVKLLAYFCEEFRESWTRRAEEMLERMVAHAECACIQCEDPADYAEIIHRKLMGGTK